MELGVHACLLLDRQVQMGCCVRNSSVVVGQRHLVEVGHWSLRGIDVQACLSMDTRARMDCWMSNSLIVHFQD